MSQGIDIAELTLHAPNRTVSVEGQTVEGVDSTGRARLYTVTGPGLQLTVRDTEWSSGEHDVVVTDRHDSAQRFDALVERLRLGVLDRGGPWVDLRQARVKANGRANLFDATAAELDEGAGVDVAELLRAHGTLDVGTRAALLGDDGRMRNRLGARLEPRTGVAAVLAYVATRIAPVARDVTA